MPYADPDRRREYDREYKQKQRAQATTKKRFNTRQTASEIETVDDVHGLLAVVEGAISFVRNDRQSTGVTKGRALAYIASIIARMLPLLEAADAQTKDWDKIRREDEVVMDFTSKSAKDSQTVYDYIDLTVRIDEEVARRRACEVHQQG
jgi:hypothetical protein